MRQDLMKIKIDPQKIVKITNESNLGNVLKSKIYFFKFLYFSILNKFIHKILNYKNNNIYKESKI